MNQVNNTKIQPKAMDQNSIMRRKMLQQQNKFQEKSAQLEIV